MLQLLNRSLFVVVVTSAFAGTVLTACPQMGPACRVGADCTSGICLSDGTCAMPPTADGAVDSGTDGSVIAGDGGEVIVDGGDGGPNGDADAGSDGGQDSGVPTTCVPNRDGIIDRGEVFSRAGLRATYKVSNSTTFATTGTASTDGGFTWDFTTALTGDTGELVETHAMSGAWFESDFPNADYYSALGQRSGLLGVFQSKPDGIYLMGSVSPTDGVVSTLLVNTPPVKVMQFPLKAGDHWTSSVSVVGRLNGVTVFTTFNHTYESWVDKVGVAKTPFADFSVLRVRTDFENPNLFPAQTQRSFAWTTECFGTVASVFSELYESSVEFTSAKEVRRISP